MILVTGGTGFLGSELLLKILQNNSITAVRAIYRTEENLEKTKQHFHLKNNSEAFNRIAWMQADILDVSALATVFSGIHYVYHCAALISFDPSDDEKLRKTNIEGTANVVNFCLDFKAKKLLYVSSIAALGDLLPNETIVSETSDWNPELPHSDYAISKFGAEMEVWRAQQEGLDVVVINPGVILGAATNKEDWQEGSAKIFSQIATDNRFYTKGSTGFVGISDVVYIMLQLMHSDIKNEKFIVVSENVDYKTLSILIAKSIGQKPAKIYAKKWLTNIAWRIDWIATNIFSQKRKLSKAMSNSLHATDIYDNQKIKKAIDFEFQDIDSCIEGIGETYINQHKII